MNDDLEFKDKEIEKIATGLNKEGKHEFGQAFKQAIAQNEGNLEVHQAEVANAEAEAVGKKATDEALSGATKTDTSTPKYDPVLKTLQTYERDIAEAIRNKDASVTSINLAKQKKQLEEEKQRMASGGKAAEKTPAEKIERREKASRSGLTILVSLVLILAGVGLFGSIYYFISNRPAPVVPVSPSLITVDQTQTSDIFGLGGSDVSLEVIRLMNSVEGGEDHLTRIKLMDGVAEQKSEITPGKFFELAAKNAPGTLGRALGGEWVLGAYGSGSASVPFILTSVASYENAFEGMLRWEANIATDFGPMFIKSSDKISEVTGRSFEDQIIRNKDVRVLRDTSGNIVLLYSFLDQKNLVITTSENAFAEILNRFFSSRIVR